MPFRLTIRARLLLSSLVGMAGLLLLTALALSAVRTQMIEDRIGKVRDLAQVALSLLHHNYDRTQRGEIDEATAKSLALAALRDMRYGRDEYFFVDDFDCVSILLPIRPEWEGRDFSQSQDTQGRPFVRLQRDTALRGGGVVRYDFARPGSLDVGEKLSYVLPFTPWRWFVATGIYLDDVDAEIYRVLLQAGAVLASVAVATVLLTRAISRGITKPLGRLTTAIRRLTDRDYSVPVGDQDRADEVGDIARAVEIFRATGRAFEALQQELRAQEEKARLTAIRLDQTSRLVTMGEMATALAHELNQPLAAIANYCMGSVHRLEADGGDRTAVLDALRKATRQANRAAGIIGRVRTFLRRSTPNLEPLSLKQVVAETALAAELDAARDNVALVLDIPDDLPMVRADPVMISQVMLNLIRNGLNALEAQPPERRRLVIACVVRPGAVETTVSDFGCGITEADRDKIFAPFYTTKPEGMGMGLTICRTILEYHGGQLWMTPNPAGGSVFHVSLPMDQNP
jgi:signal transduction histidine kinase